MSTVQRKFVYPSMGSLTFHTSPRPSARLRAYRNEMKASSWMKRLHQASVSAPTKITARARKERRPEEADRQSTTA